MHDSTITRAGAHTQGLEGEPPARWRWSFLAGDPVVRTRWTAEDFAAFCADNNLKSEEKRVNGWRSKINHRRQPRPDGQVKIAFIYAFGRVAR